MSNSKRLEFHNILKDLFGSEHIYYQPPENIKMEYPCIRYSKDTIDSKYANNKSYLLKDAYQVIVIDKKPDNDVIKKLLELPLSSYVRHYSSDNLNHDVIKIYY